MKNLSQNSKRYSLIDAIRGFAIVNMVVFHFLYDLLVIFGYGNHWNRNLSTFVWEQCICFSFIIISGVSFNFSKNGYKRGILLNLFGFLITIVTVIALREYGIWFGILNFLGCAMLILQPFKSYIEKIPPLIGAVLSLVLFLFLYGVPRGYVGFYLINLFKLPDFLYQCKYLAFLGLPSSDFSSSDYFPVIPWIFLFLAGFFAWRVIKRCKADGIFKVKIPVLDFIGRHSLVIYIVHQPLLMLLCYMLI